MIVFVPDPVPVLALMLPHEIGGVVVLRLMTY